MQLYTWVADAWMGNRDAISLQVSRRGIDKRKTLQIPFRKFWLALGIT